MPSATIRAAVDAVCSLFPPDTQARGVNRGYFDYCWYTEVVAGLMTCAPGACRVLDLGAGAGIVPLALARLGARAFVLDTYAEYAAVFDNQMGTTSAILDRFRHNGVQAVHGSIEPYGLPFSDSSVEIVTLFAVIEHLHRSPKALLSEVRRVLKPNGYFVVSTPNIGWIRTRLRLLGGGTVHFPIADWFDSAQYFGHIREYTLSELSWMVGRAGLKIERASYGNRTHLSTRDRHDPERWHRRFLINSPRRLVEAAAIAAAAVYPPFRYSMLVVGRKPAG